MQKRSGFDRDQSAVAHDIKDQLMIAYKRIPDAVSTRTGVHTYNLCTAGQLSIASIRNGTGERHLCGAVGAQVESIW